MITTSAGKMAFELAQMIYKLNRSFVDALVKSGMIKPSQAQLEFAKLVARDFGHYGLQVSKHLARLL